MLYLHRAINHHDVTVVARSRDTISAAISQLVVVAQIAIRSDMITIRLSFVIALLSSMKSIIEAEAGARWSCGRTLGGLASATLGKHDIDWDDRAVENERVDNIDRRLLSAGYLVFEKHLKRKVKDNNFDLIIRQVEKSLLREMIAKYSSDEPESVRAKLSSGCLSERLKIEHEALSKRVIMINALLRLKDLKKVKESGFECTLDEWHILEENNRIAMDPIGKRHRQETSGDRNQLARIDNLITELARQRAEHCLPDYAAWLSNPNFAGYMCVKQYWDLIFAHRFSSNILLDTPKRGLELIENMSHGIEADEVDIVLEFVQRIGATQFLLDVHNNGLDEIGYIFEKELLNRCDTYILMMSPVFGLIDFDMQLKGYLSREVVDQIEYNPAVAQQRAYYVMCKKLVQEKDRFMQFLRDMVRPETSR